MGSWHHLAKKTLDSVHRMWLFKTLRSSYVTRDSITRSVFRKTNSALYTTNFSDHLDKNLRPLDARICDVFVLFLEGYFCPCALMLILDWNSLIFSGP